MKNNLKLAGLGLATTLALTVQSSAQAYDFDFEFNDGINFIEGTIFGLSEGVSTPTSVIASSTELGFFNRSFIQDGSNSGAPNSGTFTVVGGVITNDDWYGLPDGNVSEGQLFLSREMPNQPCCTSYVPYFANNSGFSDVIRSNTVNYSLSTPTAVPFGVSGDLSILILGGLYGASRLRKTIATRKQVNNQSL